MMENNLDFTAKTPEQEQVLFNKSHELVLWGPGGSGKTHVAAIKAILYGIKQRGNRVFLIRRKKVDLRATLWKKFIELIPDALITKKDENQMIVHISNGSEFWGLGLDSDYDVNKLASTESGFVVVEEATEINEAHYDEKVQRSNRLPSVPFHQILLLCNPQEPAHWIHQRFILQKHPDNIYMPTIPKEAGILPRWWYDDYLKNLKGVFGLRYRDGKWVALEGVVYPFDPRKHVIPPIQIPRDGKRVVAIDFGFDHPFVCLFFYVSPEDKWYLYRQIYHSQRRVEEHAKDISRYCKQDGIIPDLICDHDAENRADLEHVELYTVPAEKARLAGQQAVYKLFEQNRIFFFENSLVEIDVRRQMMKLPTKIEDEFPLYCWATRGKEDMIKEFDDGMDAMRYAVYYELVTGGTFIEETKSKREMIENWEDPYYDQLNETMGGGTDAIERSL